MSPTSSPSVVSPAATGAAGSRYSLHGELRLVGRHSLIYMAGPALSNIVGFVMIPIYTRFISSSEYGVMSLVDVVMALTMMVLSLGISDGMTRFYFGESSEGERRRLVSTAIIAPAVLGLPLILIAVVLADSLRQPLGIDTRYIGYLRLALMTAWFSMLAEIGYCYLRMCYLSRVFLMITVVQIGLSVLLNLLFVVGFAWGIWGVLYSTLLVQGGIGLTMMILIFVQTQAWPSLRQLRRLLAFGVHLVPSTVALQLSNYLNPLMLRWLLPGDPWTALAQVGLFSVGQKVAVVVNRFLTVPFNAFWRPRRMELVVQNSAQTRHILARMCSYSTLLTCQLALLISVLAEDVLALLLDPSYATAYRVVPWIAAAYVILGLEHHFATGMHYAQRTWWATPIGLAALSTLVCCNLLFVTRFGMVAAAVATLVSVSVRSGLFLVVSQRMYYIPYEMGRLFVLGAVAVLLFMLASYVQLESSSLRVLIRSLIGTSLVPCLYLLKFFSAAELDFARRRFRQIRA